MGCSLDVQTEPYHPAYFLINGRSMPDLMDPNYASEYPHQPYNGNPHMHPGELTLIRTIGQGRWQHPFHEHANHVRILARDGNLQLSPTNPTTSLSGLLMFNTDTTPGEAFDGIFYFSGRGLNWDPYGHHPAGTTASTNPYPTDPLASLSCTPDANGYNTGNPAALNYYEWCQDHSAMCQRAAPQLCLIRMSLQTAPGTAALLTSVRMRLCAGRMLTAIQRPTPTARICCLRTYSSTPPASVAGRLCGTRTTSARSRPTTSSPAEC